MTMLFRLTAYSADEKILEILRSEPRFACDSAHSCGSGFPTKDKGQSRKRLSLRPTRWWAMLVHCNLAR